MIEYRPDDDLFRSGAEALVNPVNCVGVMGKGLAFQFRRRFPANYEIYVEACRSGALRPGKLLITEDRGTVIINFPTKRHWRDPSRMEDIEAGLKALAQEVRRRQIASVAVPMLGCGLGGLQWSEVGPLIERYLGGLEARVLVYGPGPVRDETQGSSR
jgi:O-acetyl-ADP-ribose deacetylase (regulator of RNase III)